jgi:hypothetical protein
MQPGQLAQVGRGPQPCYTGKDARSHDSAKNPCSKQVPCEHSNLGEIVWDMRALLWVMAKQTCKGPHKTPSASSIAAADQHPALKRQGLGWQDTQKNCHATTPLQVEDVSGGRMLAHSSVTMLPHEISHHSGGLYPSYPHPCKQAIQSWSVASNGMTPPHTPTHANRQIQSWPKPSNGMLPLLSIVSTNQHHQDGKGSLSATLLLPRASNTIQSGSQQTHE